MNIFNKIVVVLILLFLIFLSILSVVNEFIGRFSWSEIAGRLFSPDRDIPTWVTILAFLAIFIICILFLVLEFRRKREKKAKIYNVKAGKAMITIDTIEQQISDSVLTIDGLKNLKVHVTPKSGGVIIDMMVALNQNLNIPEKMTEIIKTARDVSTEKLNIKVVDTKVTVTNLIPEEKPKPEKNKMADLKEIQEPIKQNQLITEIKSSEVEKEENKEKEQGQ